MSVTDLHKDQAPPSDLLRSEEGALVRLHQIIRERCILTSKSHWLASSTGGAHVWLIDLRQAFLDAEALDIIADLFWDRYAHLLPFQLGGLEIAAVPLVAGLLMKARQRGLSVNGFILRKERKPTGVGKVLEGRIDSSPIFVVDDLINSANTLEKVRVTLDELGYVVDRVFVVIDYEATLGDAWKARHGFSVSSLFKLHDFGLTMKAPTPPPANSYTKAWEFSASNPNHFHVVPKSSPAVAGDKVVFASDAGTMWALEAATGKPIWDFSIREPHRKGIFSRAVISGDRVMFGAYDGNLYSLHLADGSEAWRYDGADWIGSSPAISESDDLLWIGLEHARPGNQGSVAAFRLSSGEKVWQHWVPEYVHGSPTFSRRHGVIAIGGNDHHLYCLDALSGELQWKFATGGPIKEAPAFDETRGLIYFGSFDGGIRAIDTETGELVWTIQTQNAIYSTPLLAEGKLFVTSTDKYLHIVDLEQSAHRKMLLHAKSCSSPTLIGDRVFFGANNGVVFEMDPVTEEVTGRLQLPDAMTNRVAYCAGHDLYLVLTYMNQIVAFRRER